ncbi:MAG TPA: TetR/AcrR family transcriptional regulator [Methylomusa anaerophila]|uniref:Bacterial regulatory proteins, tetR family n=1 Tax=Methylomusa anaerophila TaxID=1930071 RepID=A0A348AMA3_9FIRM|nr:TetR/AcrR family transcriptional regulator [Methylomusa anaerophila]BBB92201.1 bacterial regulatory proteins, tetR family [Methylomusa anaerophila]HML87785.1 TetR/AcrR family transcriptional regulator [Methylomusa anaerophila]
MDELKDLILDKAKDRFDRFGFKKTTMDEISRDCKISKKTIYEQFKDKEDLFICLFIRESRKAREIIFARMGEIIDPLDKLIQLVKTATSYFNEDNFLTRLLKSNDDLFSPFLIMKYRCIAEEEVISIIADIISEGKKQGKLRDVDEKVTAYAGLKLFQAFSYMQTMEFCKEKEAQGYYTDVLVDFLVNAIIKK